MKRTSRLCLILALATTFASALAVPSFAARGDLGRPAALQATPPGGPTQNSWVGGAAAVGCGFGIRYRFVGGGSPVYNGITVLLCLIMLADGMKG
jgi:hypothetical protein